jgi:hypothetical protein
MPEPADPPAGSAPPASVRSRVRSLSWTRRVATPPDATWARFLSELWIGGAGFGPRPVVEERGDDDGRGCTRRIGAGARGVRERITATAWPQHLEYRVVNPSWTTYPVDHHLGTVAFVPLADGGTEVRWTVAFAPKRGAGPFVTAATRFVIGRYLDALARACG